MRGVSILKRGACRAGTSRAEAITAGATTTDAPRPLPQTVTRNWLASPWTELAALVLITALGAFLRFWQLTTIPPGFHYDEAFEALEAWRLLTQPGYHPIFFPGNFGVEPLFIYLTALAFKLLGASPLTMRAVAALLGTLTVPALFLLVKEMIRSEDRIPIPTALLAAAVLATMRWHVHFSRVGIEPILVPLLLVLMLWAFWRGLRTGSLAVWVTLGLVAGLGPYTYPAGRLLPLVVVAMLGLILLLRPLLLKGRWRGILVAGVVAVVIFAPLGWHWARNPGELILRSQQVDVGSSAEAGLGRNLLLSLGMFNFRGDNDPRNNVPGMPALDILMSIPFCIGMILALWRWRRPAFGSLLVAGLVMFLPTVLSEYAPHFRRALGTTPIVAIVCGLGLAAMLGRRDDRPATETFDARAGVSSGATGVPPPSGAPYVPWRLQQSGDSPEELAKGMNRLRWLGRVVVVAVILAGSAILGAVAYFGKWGPSSDLYYAYDQGLWEIGGYVAGLPTNEQVFVSPRPASDTTLRFAWRSPPATSGSAPALSAGGPRAPFPQTTRDFAAAQQSPLIRHFDGRHAFVIPGSVITGTGVIDYVVIEHEDFRGAHLLRELFPGASETKTFRDRDGTVYARVFQVAGPTSLAREPRYAAGAKWPGIELVGYDLNQDVYKPGDIVYLQFWWRVSDPIGTDWTVFTHLLGPQKADGSTVWAGDDARPGGGSIPTPAWIPGDLILDEYQVPLPSDMPPGEYQIEMGLYDLAEGGRRAITVEPPGQDHVTLGAVKVMPLSNASPRQQRETADASCGQVAG